LVSFTRTTTKHKCVDSFSFQKLAENAVFSETENEVEADKNWQNKRIPRV